MKIQSLRLRGFRNIENLELEPAPQLNFIVGPNAQGKTSILEGIGLISTLKSFRNSKPLEMIHFGEPFSSVWAKINKTDRSGDWSSELEVRFQRNDISHRVSKTALINQKTYGSSLNYLRQKSSVSGAGIHSIVFNPSDHEMIRGNPDVRRIYLNQVIGAEDVSYLELLKRYKRSLEQRNALMKAGTSGDAHTAYTEQLVESGSEITHRRLVWLKKLSKILPERLQTIAPQQAPLSVSYASKWMNFRASEGNLPSYFNTLSGVYFSGQGTVPSIEQIEQNFWKSLSNLSTAEWRMGTTLCGPHRDDWSFHLGEQPLKGHGSQGEVRAVLLALKLSEIELFQKETGLQPVFLLDDFSSELDQQRRKFLLEHLAETELQVFVTSTENVFSFGNLIEVRSGSVALEQ